MKYFLLIATVLFAQVLADSDLEKLETKLKENLAKCATTHELTQEQLTSIMTFKMVTDKPSKCFLACFAKEMDFMKNDNKFDKRKITTTIEPFIELLKKEKQEDVAKKIGEVIDICVPLQKGSGDECAAARNGYECIIENAKKMELFKDKIEN